MFFFFAVIPLLQLGHSRGLFTPNHYPHQLDFLVASSMCGSLNDAENWAGVHVRSGKLFEKKRKSADSP